MRWSANTVKLEALKYKTRTEFYKNNPSAYNYASKHKILDVICEHMLNKIQKEKNYWNNKQHCLTEAIKYTSKKKFIDNSQGAYKQSISNGWFDEITSHMDCTCKPKGYWNIQNIKTEALKYKSKKEFKRHSNTAYKYALKYNVIDDVCKHMNSLGNKYNRLVYIFIFEDKTVYVGLTSNFDRRMNEHYTSTKSPIYNYILNNNKLPEYELITDYISYDKAQELESYYVRYFQEMNYNVLNKAKTGGLGGTKI